MIKRLIPGKLYAATNPGLAGHGYMLRRSPGTVCMYIGLFNNPIELTFHEGSVHRMLLVQSQKISEFAENSQTNKNLDKYFKEINGDE
jgi:hypothetical protein